MAKLNPKVTEYIAKSAGFAAPVLNYLRELIHSTCPDVEEEIKWGIPHYGYKGDHLCMMAGFKNHCSFSLYKAEFMKDKQIAESVKEGKKFGYMDKLKFVSDLPPMEVLQSLIKEAMAINEQGIKKVVPKSDKPKVLEVPGYLENALRANPKAEEIFYSKSDSFRKEYIVWITDAKTEDTRQKRIEQSLDWIAQGKGRFWQYAK